MTNPKAREFYTVDLELDLCINRMKQACAGFYASAVQTGNHPFIEFTGIISAYIQLCEEALKQEKDFRMLSIHTGEHLPMPGHKLAYINEKLECIFGMVLAERVSPEVAAFQKDRAEREAQDARNTKERLEAAESLYESWKRTPIRPQGLRDQAWLEAAYQSAHDHLSAMGVFLGPQEKEEPSELPGSAPCSEDAEPK